MPLTPGETAFAYAMQNAEKAQDLQSRITRIERVLMVMIAERQLKGETVLPELAEYVMYLRGKPCMGQTF